MQKLNVELEIPVPDGYVLIRKVEYMEYKELEKEKEQARWWSMTDLQRRLGKSSVWIRDNILLPNRFKKILDINHGGFVAYPSNKGQVWTFQASKMTKFLEEHFADIFIRD